MERNAERPGEIVDDDIPVADGGSDEIEICAGIGPQPMGRRLQVAQEERGAVVEWVGDLNRRLDPAKAVAVQGELREEG
jgi:hypothetical protein